MTIADPIWVQSQMAEQRVKLQVILVERQRDYKMLYQMSKINSGTDSNFKCHVLNVSAHWRPLYNNSVRLQF